MPAISQNHVSKICEIGAFHTFNFFVFHGSLCFSFLFPFLIIMDPRKTAIPSGKLCKLMPITVIIPLNKTWCRCFFIVSLPPSFFFLLSTSEL